MAKGYNPADAHRKAQKAKDKKKNKQERVKAKELKDVKKGTGELEREVRDLSQKERQSGLSSSERADLDVAKAELARLRKAKEDYIAKNPDAKDAVIAATNKGKGREVNEDDDADSEEDGAVKYGSVKVGGVMIPVREKLEAERQGLRFSNKGRLLNPEKSAYYDAVFNPFGVPPPGMPWRAKPPTAEELAAQQAAEEESSSEEDSDDDIPMPEEPAPGKSDDSEDDSSDDEDSIPLPDGPPPPKANGHGNGLTLQQPPLPPGIPPFLPPAMRAQPPYYGQILPPPPRGRLNYTHAPVYPSPYTTSHLPPPPPGLPSRPSGSPLPPGASPILSAPPSSLPAKPNLTGASISALAIPASHGPKQAEETKKPLTEEEIAKLRASATISAAPQVRDLKKEATAFIPQAALRKRKRPNAPAATPVAAMSHAKEVDEEVDEGLLQRAKAMKLPPGSGGNMPGVSLPPGFAMQPHLPQPQAMEEQDAGEDVGVALPPGFRAQNEEEEEDVGPARPSMAGDATYYLPGMDEDEEGGDDAYQGPALPQAVYSGGSTLPGFDDDDDQAEEVGYPQRSYQSVTVEDDEEA